MRTGLFFSIALHAIVASMSIISLPFLFKDKLEAPLAIPIEMITIAEKTNIPIVSNVKKIIEEPEEKKEERVVKKEAKKEVIEEKKVEKVPLPEKKEKAEKVETEINKPVEEEVVQKVNPKPRPKIEKKIFDIDKIAALVDKQIEETAKNAEEKEEETTNFLSTQSSLDEKLTLSEKDAIRAQLFSCWRFPTNIPYSDDLVVEIIIYLKPNGTLQSPPEVKDHARMNKPSEKFFRIVAESALRAIKVCEPLRVPQTNYEKWKKIQINFDPREVLRG